METNPKGSPSTLDRFAALAEQSFGDGPAEQPEAAPSAPVEEPETESFEGEEVEAEASNEAEETEAEEVQPETSDDDEWEEFDLGDDLKVDVPKSLSERLKELKEGNLRQADYTRKTQELSEQRKTIETREQELARREAEIANHLATLQPQEPDWQKLAEEDPMGWQLQKMEWDKAQQQRHTLQQQYQQRQEQQRQQIMRQEAQKLVEAVPEWNDNTTYQKEWGEIANMAMTDYGYTSDELADLIDSRAYRVLRDAWKARQTKASVETAKAKIKDKPKMMKAGAAKPNTDSRKTQQKALRMKLKKSGNHRDLASLLIADMER